MTFILQTAGVRDEVKLSNLFEKKVVEHVEGTVPIRHIDKDLAIDATQRYGRERIKQAYGDGHADQQARELTAEQLMSSPVLTLPINASLAQAWRFFREHRFRHVPVVDQQGGMKGIVSDRDLLSAVESGLSEKDFDLEKTQISTLMKTQVLTATADTIISQIAAVFFGQRIGSMPIMREEQLVGIITRSDILGAIVYSTPLERWA